VVATVSFFTIEKRALSFKKRFAVDKAGMAQATTERHP
jgi:hypothetical protein